MSLVHWVVALWLVVSPLLQVNLLPVRGSGIYLGMVLLVLVVLTSMARVVRRPDLLPARSKLTVPLVALGLTAAVAGLQGALFYDRTVAGQHRYVSVQIYAVALVGLPVAAAFAIPILMRTLADLRLLRIIIVVASCLLVVRGAAGYVAPGIPWPSAAWWPLAAAHGGALVMAWILFEAHRRRWEIPLAAAFVIAFLTVVVFVPFYADVPNQWLSGWIAASLPVGLLVVARFPRVVLPLGLPLLALFVYLEYPQIQRVFFLSQREGDFMRLRLWEDALKLTYQRPLFGIGPGNYLDYNMRYGQLGLMLSSPHGNYEQIAAEMGFVGLGFAVWLFLRALGLGLRLYRAAGEALTRSLAIAATCSLAGQFCAAFLGDFVVPSYHNGGYTSISATVYAWVMMGVLMSLERLEGDAALPSQTAAQAQRRDQSDEAGGHPLER